MEALNPHPKVGASWEGLIVEVVEAIIDHLGLQRRPSAFLRDPWRRGTGPALDARRQRVDVEIKRTSAPKVTRSMRIAMDDLGLEEAIVVYAGHESYRLGERVRAVAAKRLGVDLGLDDFSRR